MRTLALLLVASLLAAAPAAAAKRVAVTPKRAAMAKKTAKKAAKRVARGWRARTPKVVVVAPAAAPAPNAAAPSPPVPVDAPAPPTDGPATPTPAAPPPPPPVPACDPSPWLGAIADDVGGFRLRLTRTCVPAGRVLVQFRNEDLAVHNLWAEGVTPAAAAREIVAEARGETMVTAAATLQAGTWRLFCSFEGHEAMSRLVDVSASRRTSPRAR